MSRIANPKRGKMRPLVRAPSTPPGPRRKRGPDRDRGRTATTRRSLRGENRRRHGLVAGLRVAKAGHGGACRREFDQVFVRRRTPSTWRAGPRRSPRTRCHVRESVVDRPGVREVHRHPPSPRAWACWVAEWGGVFASRYGAGTLDLASLGVAAEDLRAKRGVCDRGREAQTGETLGGWKTDCPGGAGRAATASAGRGCPSEGAGMRHSTRQAHESRTAWTLHGEDGGAAGPREQSGPEHVGSLPVVARGGASTEPAIAPARVNPSKCDAVGRSWKQPRRPTRARRGRKPGASRTPRPQPSPYA